MPDNASFTYIDYSNETSTTSVNIADVTAAEFDNVETALQALNAAIAGLTLGNLRARNTSVGNPTLLGPPSDPQAQREKKWLVTFRTTQSGSPDVGRFYNVELPCADLSLLDSGSDVLWQLPAAVPAGAIQTFKDAFEAIAVSPTGSTVTVTAIRYVGRRS